MRTKAIVVEISRLPLDLQLRGIGCLGKGQAGGMTPDGGTECGRPAGLDAHAYKRISGLSSGGPVKRHVLKRAIADRHTESDPETPFKLFQSSFFSEWVSLLASPASLVP